MNKENIKDMFEQIETPEYDPAGEIIKKINQGYRIKPKLSRRKRLMIIAAATMAVIILMGAGLNMITMRVFDADGNSFLKYIPFDQRFRPITEQTIFEREFRDYDNSENILIVISEGGGGFGLGLPKRDIYDYDELQKYLDGEIFKLPEYIPDGYEFGNAVVNFYLDEDFDLETAELLVREEKFGNIYEKYYIPENPGNVNWLYLCYVKEENGEEFQLWYDICLMPPFYIDTNFSGTVNTEGEILQMPQFDRNIILSTEHDYGEGQKFTQHSFSGIKIIPAKQTHGIMRVSDYYGTAGYSINTHSLPREEIIKIAESIR